MGCASSADVVPTRSHKLVDDYIKHLRLETTDNKSTHAYLFAKAETIINSSHSTQKIEPMNSPCCILEITTREGKTWGTCTLISPILVLTSAMNAYSLKDKSQTTMVVRFYNKASTSVEVVRVFVPEEYQKGNLFEDYALLVLHEPAAELGFFGLSVVQNPISIENFFVNMLAFPIPLKTESAKY